METKKYSTSIFLFTRDLRLDDNTGLLYALKNSETVIPCFIFGPEKFDKSLNAHFNNNHTQFLSESLIDLDSQLKAKESSLNMYYGSLDQIIPQLIKITGAQLLCTNQGLTPTAIKSEKNLKALCLEEKCDYQSFEDLTLVTKVMAMTGRKEDKFYQKFLSYYNNVAGNQVKKPVQCINLNFYNDNILLVENSNKTKGGSKKKSAKVKKSNKEPSINLNIDDFGRQFYTENPKIEIRGGRSIAVKILTTLGDLGGYEAGGHSLTFKTSRLSAHNNVGNISIREVYYAAKKYLGYEEEAFFRQLYARDFYFFVGYFAPQVFTGPLRPKYGNIKWNKSLEDFEKWKTGQTGFPVVDASMRQMNTTGYMAFRSRMIVSNFLVKDLHINWQWGEKYFEEKLIDIDASQNNGGWQWSAGSGANSRPYFEIFSPHSQAKRFDPEAQFIKQWCPGLKRVPKKEIFEWEKYYDTYERLKYPNPMINHREEAAKSKELYLAAISNKIVKPKIKAKESKPKPTKTTRRQKRITKEQYDDKISDKGSKVSKASRPRQRKTMKVLNRGINKSRTGINKGSRVRRGSKLKNQDDDNDEFRLSDAEISEDNDEDFEIDKISTRSNKRNNKKAKESNIEDQNYEDFEGNLNLPVMNKIKSKKSKRRSEFNVFFE